MDVTGFDMGKTSFIMFYGKKMCYNVLWDFNWFCASVEIYMIS